MFAGNPVGPPPRYAYPAAYPSDGPPADASRGAAAGPNNVLPPRNCALAAWMGGAAGALVVAIPATVGILPQNRQAPGIASVTLIAGVGAVLGAAAAARNRPKGRGPAYAALLLATLAGAICSAAAWQFVGWYADQPAQRPSDPVLWSVGISMLAAMALTEAVLLATLDHLARDRCVCGAA